MRKLLAVALIGVGLLTGPLNHSGASAQSASLKLAVLIVVDQMRADFVDRFQGDWNGGLKRMVRDGAWFSRAAYPYLSTVTCSGHATVGTGAYPRSVCPQQQPLEQTNRWPCLRTTLTIFPSERGTRFRFIARRAPQCSRGRQCRGPSCGTLAAQ